MFQVQIQNNVANRIHEIIKGKACFQYLKHMQHVLGWSGGENSAIRLLERIASCGSNNRAAKDVGLSYKAAGKKIENLNNLSEKPLTVRQAGGSGGGAWATGMKRAGHRDED